MSGSKKPRNKPHNKLKTIAAREAVKALSQGLDETGKKLSARDKAAALADIERYARSQSHSIVFRNNRPLDGEVVGGVLDIVYKAHDSIETGAHPTANDVGFLSACVTTVAKYAVDVKDEALERLAQGGLKAIGEIKVKKVLLGSYRFDQFTRPAVVECLNKYIQLVEKMKAKHLYEIGEFVNKHDYRVSVFGGVAA